MARIVDRRKLNFWEELYLPAIASGLKRTFAQMFEPRVTLQYPEERPEIHDDYRGAPGLVRDQDGREKCVSCQLCEYICPPRAIVIVPGEAPDTPDYDYSEIEKAPQEFYIDMLRCIYCGYCEEICPEEAIFMTDVYELNAGSRQELVHDKAKLYDIGGLRLDPIQKWKGKNVKAQDANVPPPGRPHEVQPAARTGTEPSGAKAPRVGTPESGLRDAPPPSGDPGHTSDPDPSRDDDAPSEGAR